VLAAINRAGFLTHQSQPGVPLDEHGSAQRANVSGFVSAGAFPVLMAAIADAGADLIITAARGPALEDFGPLIVITLDYGKEFTVDGGAMSPATLRLNYEDDYHPDAIEDLIRSWQVALIDPEWGRNDTLWPILAGFARRSARSR
jgi:hypothetical protein